MTGGHHCWCGRVYGPACRRAGHREICPTCNGTLSARNICIPCDARRAAAERERRAAEEADREKKRQEAEEERERKKKEKEQKAKEAEQQRGRENQQRIQKELQCRKRRTKEKMGKKKKKATTPGQPKVSKPSKRFSPVMEGVRKSARLQQLRKDGRCIF